MKDKTAWDWQTEKKEIPVQEWNNQFNWIEEPYVSPDGEQIAAIVNTDESEFNVCINGELWDETFEKAWSLRFTPDGKPVVLVSQDEEWTVCVDGSLWENRFDYIWALKFTPDGSHIAVAIQKEGEFGMAVNDQVWENLYENINGMVLSPRGITAAVVQVESMGQADIDTFTRGIFSVAVDGNVRPEKFMNIWDIAFDGQGEQIAHVFRKNRTEYSIFQADAPWEKTFQAAWEPVFMNHSPTSLLAPVRENGKWMLFKNGTPFWNHKYEQLWKVALSEDQTRIAAVVSDSFGKWTVVVNDGDSWATHADIMISDLFYGSGQTLIAVLKTGGLWTLAVNDILWDLKADKLWKPSVSSDGKVIATRFEKKGNYYLAVNSRIHSQPYDVLFDPEISPDNRSILVKAMKDGIYIRQVLSVDSIL
jgi:hypothetical protein